MSRGLSIKVVFNLFMFEVPHFLVCDTISNLLFTRLYQIAISVSCNNVAITLFLRISILYLLRILSVLGCAVLRC